MSGRVLIVDDDVAFGRTLARSLRRRGYDVRVSTSAAEARDALPAEEVDVVVLDYQLPDADGLELLEELRPVSAGAAFLMATAYPSLEVAVEAMRRGAFDYVAKGGELEECLIRVDRASEVSALRRRMAEASKGGGALSDLIGESAPMRSLKRRLELLAGADDTTVQILGETGTGKGVVARAIHAASGRAYEPFVAVDCTTIPATLVESELFGHERGAFSGATSTKMGRVEAAGRGTLFLDEIGELELPMQAKLLRLLEEREYTRVGSTRARKLEARVIAATNRNLEKAVEEGRFRADLRYRLEVFVVETPPLRERGDDVMLLTAHYLAMQARALGKSVPTMNEAVIDGLRRYAFPGNVRELRNMAEQAMLLVQGETLTLADFPVLARSVRNVSARRTPTRAPKAPPTDLATIRAEAASDERDRIVEALRREGGNVSAAARHLEISRYQLIRRLKKLGLH